MTATRELTTPRLRLDRDAVTAAAYAGLGGWAWFLYGFGALVPLLIDEQGISRTVGGLHLTAQALGGLIAGIAATALVRRFRRRGTALLAAALVSSGVLVLLVGSPTAVTLAATLVIGTGGSMLLNTLTPAMAEHHGAAGAAAISEGNAVAAGIGLVSPLAVGAGVALGWGWRPAMALTAVAMAVFVWRMRVVPGPEAALDAVMAPRGEQSRTLPRAFWPRMVLIVLCVGVEFSVTTWTAELLRREIGMPDGAASAAVSAVVGGMALGRLVVGRLALRFPVPPLLAAAIVLAAGGWLVLWTASTPAQALAGLVVTGLGVAGQFPLGAALMLAATPGQQDAASGRLSIGISVSIGLAPFLLGAVADSTSIRTAFLIVPALLGAALLLLTAVSGGAVWARRRAA